MKRNQYCTFLEMEFAQAMPLQDPFTLSAQSPFKNTEKGERDLLQKQKCFVVPFPILESLRVDINLPVCLFSGCCFGRWHHCITILSPAHPAVHISGSLEIMRMIDEDHWSLDGATDFVKKVEVSDQTILARRVPIRTHSRRVSVTYYM